MRLFYFFIFYFCFSFSSYSSDNGVLCSTIPSEVLSTLGYIQSGTKGANTAEVKVTAPQETPDSVLSKFTAQLKSDTESQIMSVPNVQFFCRNEPDKITDKMSWVTNNVSAWKRYYSINYMAYRKSPPRACDTPKTDDQCNKGKTATITGNDVFWATGNYKGCTFTAKDGVFVKAADGTMTGDATSTGSTGKSWCETTDSSYNPADDEALSKNPAFSPAKDNDPKNCKNGWVQAGGGKFHCLNDTSGNVDAPPDKVNPDGSINSDKDGKPKPPDAGVGKPPTDGTGGDGGGGSGGDGGGGDCEGEDCEGGGGGTKPPARPADPWADILDAADVARVKADTQSVQDELADFYRSAASGFQININKPAAGAMPSYGDITQGGQKISLSMSWLDKISFADGRAGVLVLCSLIAAYIILVRR